MPKNLQIFIAIIILHVTFLNSISLAQAKVQSQITAEEWAVLKLSKLKHSVRIRVGSDYIVSIKSLRNRLLQIFDQTDFGLDGVTQEDYEVLETQKFQKQFARNLQTWLQKDLNRDFKVTIKELKIHYHSRASSSIRSGQTYLRKTKEQIEETLNDMLLRDLVMDTNNDAEISFEEAKKHYENLSQNLRYPNLSRRFNILNSRKIPFSFDKNENKIIEKNEFTQIIDQVISRYNKDKNNVLSATEIAELDAKSKAIKMNLRNKRFRPHSPFRQGKKNKFNKEI